MEDKRKKVFIPEEAKRFAKASYKKFKKKNRDLYDSKKEIKEAYISYLIDLLPGTIEFLIKYGHIKDQEVQDAKTAIYSKFMEETFCKILRKELKNGSEIKNIRVFPIILADMLKKVEQANKELIAKDPNADIYATEHVVELSKLILKKKLKKFVKEGISEKLAFDLLSVIPTVKILNISKQYSIRMVYEVLYEHAKTIKIDFNKVMKLLVEEEHYPVFIIYALLEKKERFGYLNDNQKVLYLDISNWVFNMMESQDKAVIQHILETFINSRRKDDRIGKDCNRRYVLTTLPETDYPRIVKTIQRILSDEPTFQKYL